MDCQYLSLNGLVITQTFNQIKNINNYYLKIRLYLSFKYLFFITIYKKI